MSKKIPRAGGESTEVSDELYMAHHVHTLAQLLAQRLTGGWSAPRQFAESFVPPMGASPWTHPWSSMGQAAPMGHAVPTPAPMYHSMLYSCPEPVLVAANKLPLSAAQLVNGTAEATTWMSTVSVVNWYVSRLKHCVALFITLTVYSRGLVYGMLFNRGLFASITGPVVEFPSNQSKV